MVESSFRASAFTVEGCLVKGEPCQQGKWTKLSSLGTLSTMIPKQYLTYLWLKEEAE